MFADDLKIYRTIKSDQDVIYLQRDLNAIYAWCLKNQMVLNVSKCYHIKFSRKHSIEFNSHYFINNVLVTEVSSLRDLGVIVDQKMDFKQHFEHIGKKAAKLAGFVIRQTKTFKDPEVPIIIFNCYVRPIIEYCSQIWNPSYAVHSTKIEKLQKQFLYHLAFADNRCRTLTSYQSRLTHYKMSTLEHRRKIADVLFLYKIVNGLIDCPDMVANIFICIPRISSRLINRKTFFIPTHRTNYGRNSPLSRMCSYYNDICHEADIFNSSVNRFKRILCNL